MASLRVVPEPARLRSDSHADIEVVLAIETARRSHDLREAGRPLSKRVSPGDREAVEPFAAPVHPGNAVERESRPAAVATSRVVRLLFVAEQIRVMLQADAADDVAGTQLERERGVAEFLALVEWLVTRARRLSAPLPPVLGVSRCGLLWAGLRIEDSID